MLKRENDKTGEGTLEQVMKRKRNPTCKTNNTTQANKSEGTSEKWKTKKIPRQDETIQTKQDIAKQRKKIYQQIGGEFTNTYQQLDDKERKQLGAKYGNAENMSENMGKELERLEEGLIMKIHLDLLRATLKKVPSWKTPSHDGIHGFWF